MGGSTGKTILSSAVMVGASFLLPGSAAFTTSLFFKRLAVTTALSLLSKSLAPKITTPEEQFAQQSRQSDVTSNNPIETWKIPYGQTQVGGVAVYADLSYSDSNYLNYQIVYSPVPITGYNAIYVNQDNAADESHQEFDGNSQTDEFLYSNLSSAGFSLLGANATLDIEGTGTYTTRTTSIQFNPGVTKHVFLWVRGNSNISWTAKTAQGSDPNYTDIQTVSELSGSGGNTTQLTNFGKLYEFIYHNDTANTRRMFVDFTATNSTSFGFLSQAFISPTLIEKYRNDLTINLNKGDQNEFATTGVVGFLTDDTQEAHTSSGKFLTWFRVNTQNANSTLGDHSDLRSSYVFDVPTIGGSSDISPVFTDLARAFLRIKRNDDIFQNQIPNVSAILKGVKLYDPRDSSHSATDSSTWEWSNNPALVLLDYLTNEEYGCNVGLSDIDIESVKDCANLCDEEVAVDADDDGNGYGLGKFVNVSDLDADHPLSDRLCWIALPETDGVGLPPFHQGHTVVPFVRSTPTESGVWTEVTKDTHSGYQLNAATPVLTMIDTIVKDNPRSGIILNLINSGTVATTLKNLWNPNSFYTHIKLGYKMKRYTCNGVVDTQNSKKVNIDNILTSMAGKLAYTNGKFIFLGGEYQTPAGTITEDEITGEFSITAKPPARDTFNKVKGIYSDRNQRFVPTDFEHYAPSNYLADDDDDVSSVDLQLSMVTSLGHAMRLAKITLERARYSRIIEMSCNLSVLKYQVGDTVRVTYDRWGLSAETYEVLEMSIDLNDSPKVNMVLQQTDASIYT